MYLKESPRVRQPSLRKSFPETSLGPPAMALPGRWLRLQAWLDARASARALYRIDDRGLSDLALSRSDVERVNATVQWPAWRQ